MKVSQHCVSLHVMLFSRLIFFKKNASNQKCHFVPYKWIFVAQQDSLCMFFSLLISRWIKKKEHTRRLTSSQSSPWHHLFCWLAANTLSSWQSTLRRFSAVRGESRVYLWAERFSLLELCPAWACATAAEKYERRFLKKKDTDSSSRRVSGAWIRFMFSPLSVQRSLFTKRAEKRAQHEAACTLKRRAKNSGPTARWMSLAVVWILRGTKGINKSVLCVLARCEFPFNAFPRAAMQMWCGSPEMEHNILHRPSAHVLFCCQRKRQQSRERVRVKLLRPLKFPTDRSSHLGPEELQAQTKIAQILCSFTELTPALLQLDVGKRP